MKSKQDIFSVKRLALGTVQFGLTYGLAQQRVSEDEVGRILELAAQHGMTRLDTAALYGEAEEVIGRLAGGDSRFQIITKTARCASASGAADAAAMTRHGVLQSLARLRADQIDALLVHDVADLLGPSGDAVWEVLERLKAEGRVAKIGASIYYGREIDALLARFPIDIVQVPFSALDRRLIDEGQLGRLQVRGVEVHARSVFLQGLLLMSPARADSIFPGMGNHLQKFHNYLREFGLSPLDGALYAALVRPEIGAVVLGFLSVAELEDSLAAVGRLAALKSDPRMDEFAIWDETILNPSLWQRR